MRIERKERCIAEVPGNYNFPLWRQCSRRDGHGSNGCYCKQHARMLERGRIVGVCAAGIKKWEIRNKKRKEKRNANPDD